MPEQLTRHPEVTLEVLRSSGARCGEGAAQHILTQCPAERFCKLPGGEVCIYGLADAPRMTQITAADWKALVPAAPPDLPPAAPALGAEVLISGSIGLLAGAALTVALIRWKRIGNTRP